MICYAVCSRLFFLIRTFLSVGHGLIREALGLITRTFTALAAISDHIFSPLPRPLDRIFGVVTSLMEGLAEGMDWLFEDTVCPFIEAITEIIFEYTAYVLNWLVWLVDWLLRWLPLLLSKRGVRAPMTIPLCIKILQDNGSRRAMEPEKVHALVEQANQVMSEANIQFVYGKEMEFIQKQRYFDGLRPGLPGFFHRSFSWFSARVELGCVTVFVVRDLDGVNGYGYPGANWLVIDAKATGYTLVQEIGRLSDFWSEADSASAMTGYPAGGPILDDRFSMIRSSKFARLPRFSDLI